jgi:hypothetical protein
MDHMAATTLVNDRLTSMRADARRAANGHRSGRARRGRHDRNARPTVLDRLGRLFGRTEPSTAPAATRMIETGTVG